MNLTVHTDIDDCRRIWEAAWPVRGLFDLWQVRNAFHLSFNRPMRFQAIEENGNLVGFLPLSFCEETGSYVIFPGETWEGKTWLEQNRIIARDRGVFQRLIDAVPGPLHIRYLSSSPLLQGLDRIEPDETGYLFYPGLYENDFNQYWMGFSGKTRKKIRHDCLALERSGVSFRFNRREDLDLLFRLNTQSFSERSYFHDPRFKASFERLADHLDRMGMLRITTICIGGEAAAVDMGAIFNQTYTLLAGGTDGRFKGVAKLINLHHIEWACQKQFTTVDFLCGDFNWKQRFHLSPTPFSSLMKPVSMRLRISAMKNRHMHDNGRVLVVGTTPDYVHWIRGNCPDRALFITDPKIRKAATEPSPRKEEEILVPLDRTGPAVAALKGHLEAFGLTLTGLTCFDCEALAPAARIAAAMGLSYHSVETVRNCRDKQASKTIWQDNHIPCPKTAAIATPDDARSFLPDCPDGIVLKPFYGSGSELVFLCRSQEDCHAAFEKIRKGLEKRRNNPLFCRPEPGNGLMLAESYIPGPEFSCDMMVDGKDLTIIRLARKIKTPGQPFGTIAGYLLPGKLPAHIHQADLEATLLKAARVLGIDRGICMVDFIAGKRGISLIELTPRPGGDCLPALLKAAGNLDILALALDAAENKPLKLNGCSRMATHIGWRIHAPKAGVLKKIHTGSLAQEPRVKAIHLTRKPGHVITLPPKDYDSWILGHMIIRPDKESFPETQSLLIGKRLDVEINE